MPTLFRFILILAALAALGFGLLWGMVLAVDPGTRDMVLPVPLERLPKTHL